jgi:hypothetical protein
MIVGYYNHYGYTVNSNTREIYFAGNSPLDSTSVVSVKQGLCLKALRKCCLQTCKELSKERNEPFRGIERVPDKLFKD